MKKNTAMIMAITIILLASALMACKKTNSDSATFYRVEPEAVSNTLYYSGNLLPATQISVVSPNDGVVVAQKFHYGQLVAKGDPLFEIDSSKQVSDFQQALSAYLKAKETLNNSQGSLQNTSSLYQKGLVSRNEYTQARSDYYTNELSYMQAQQQLQQAITFYKADAHIFSLSIENIRQISKELNDSNSMKDITITAPASGIALFPVSTSGDASSGSGNQKVTVGTEVKQGQLLLTIGHPDSLMMSVQAGQMDINQLKPNLPVIITSMAFPNVTLRGYIQDIDAQASMDSNSMPVFNLRILIPQISDAAKKVVKIGMSAKAQVDIVENSTISIPLSYVQEVNGNPVVMKLVKGKPQAVLIQTGKTTEDSVEVTKGLKPGDEIIAHH